MSNLKLKTNSFYVYKYRLMSKVSKSNKKKKTLSIKKKKQHGPIYINCTHNFV